MSLVDSGNYDTRKKQIIDIIRRHPGATGKEIWRMSGIEDRTWTSSVMARLRDDDKLAFNYPKGHPLRTAIDPETGKRVLRWWPVEG